MSLIFQTFVSLDSICPEQNTRGTSCPFCSNRRVCLHNSLATIARDVAQYWNHSKNEKAPEQVVAGSGFRAEWQCPICKWEWQASIAQRVLSRAGCPKCSQAQKVQYSQPTFAKAQPACLAEWDYERSDAHNIYPDSITLGSNKLVHWICSCCPRGQPHRWTASPNNRINNGQGCAVCADWQACSCNSLGSPTSAGQQACACNSLASVFLSVAAEFDAKKNGFVSSKLTAGSKRKVWWTW